MTSILENIVGIIAPHRCLSCSNENNILCDACRLQLVGLAQSNCFLCSAVTTDFATCASCKKSPAPDHVWVAGAYDGVLAQVIKQFKFARARAASQSLARLIADQLPHLSPQTMIVPVPTAPSRARQRGYDQAVMLAQQLSKYTSFSYGEVLNRNHSLRQLGATRAQRLHQAKDAFYVWHPAQVKGKNVLLIDDVVTTGATLCAATALLYQAGATRVQAAVVARQAADK